MPLDPEATFELSLATERGEKFSDCIGNTELPLGLTQIRGHLLYDDGMVIEFRCLIKGEGKRGRWQRIKAGWRMAWR